jgi:hypothetical protein
MRIGGALALSTLMLAAGMARADQAQAVLRDPAFEVTLPAGVPLPTATKTADALGVDYSAQTARGVYRIQYVDMPSADADQLFEGIKNNIKAGMTLDRDETFTHQGYRGLRMFISMPALNQVMRMDCIVVGKRLYRVWYITRTAPELATAEARAFFDSFNIKN